MGLEMNVPRVLSKNTPTKRHGRKPKMERSVRRPQAVGGAVALVAMTVAVGCAQFLWNDPRARSGSMPRYA